MITVKSFCSVLAWIAALGQASCFAQPNGDPVDQAMVVLKKRCATCHSQTQSRGDLDVSTVDSILAGSGSGQVVIPGKPEESPLYLLAAHLDNPKMPPNSPRIAQRELGYLYKWISGMTESTSRVDKEKPNSESQSMPIPEGLVAPRRLPGKAAITALAVSSDFSYAAVSGLHQVLLLSLETKTWIGGLEFPEGDVFKIRFSADGRQLFAAGGRGAQHGAVVAWEVGSFRRVFSLKTKGDALLAMDCSPDGKVIAVGGPRRVVQLIQLPDGKQIGEFKKHTDWITSLAFSPDGLMLASGDRFGGLWIWEMPTQSEFGSQRVHTAQVTSLEWSHDSNQLLSTGKDGMAGLWKIECDSPIVRWPAHQGGVDAAVSFQGKWLSAGKDNRITVWESPEKIDFSKEAVADLTQIAVSSKQNTLVASDFVGSLHLIPLSSDAIDAAAPVESIALPFEHVRHAEKPFRPKAIHRAIGEIREERTSDAAEEFAELRQAITAAEESLQQARKAVLSLEQSIERLKHAASFQETRVHRNATPANKPHSK